MASLEARAARLHAEATVIDCHNDLPLQLLMWQRSLGSAGIQDYFADYWVPEFRRGGVNVQVLPIYVDPSEAEVSLRRTFLYIEELICEAEKLPGDLAIVRSGRELELAAHSGTVALVLALEGAGAIGSDIALFSVLQRLGIRVISLTHFGRTLLADGSAEDAAGSKLPSAGIAALRELERLRILLDVSHLSEVAIDQVLEIATKPVLASHSSARAICDHHRNLRDEHLSGIGATGGVIGVNFIPAYIDPDRPTLDRVVDHIAHIAEVAGIDHVGIGSDFVKDYFEAVYPSFETFEIADGIDGKASIDGLARTGDLPNLTECLLTRGFGEDEVRKILGENFLRLFVDHF